MVTEVVQVYLVATVIAVLGLFFYFFSVAVAVVAAVVALGTEREIVTVVVVAREALVTVVAAVTNQICSKPKVGPLYGGGLTFFCYMRTIENFRLIIICNIMPISIIKLIKMMYV